MSLLNKASIITTPTAYAEDYLYSIKPAYALGSELVTNGDFSDGLNNWTDASDWWSVVNGQAYHPASTSMKQLYQDVSTVVDKKYKIRVYVNIISGTPQVFWDKVSGQQGQNLSQGFNEVIVTTFKTNSRIYFGRVNPTNAEFYIDDVSVKEITDADFDFDRNSTGTRVNEDYLIETVATNTPRIDYTNGEPSILLEPSRTNSVINSNNPSNLIGVTQTSVLSPEGINNAFRITETTANSQHYADLLTASLTSGTTYTISFFIKKGNGYTTAQIYTQSVIISSNITVNFETKSITLAGTNIVTGSEKLESYPNDWFRVSYSATAASTGAMQVYVVVKDISTYAGSTDNYTDYYGIQVEAGSYPTSLIHTSGSTVTRSADLANNAGNSDLINSTEGVLYAEIRL